MYICMPLLEAVKNLLHSIYFYLFSKIILFIIYSGIMVTTEFQANRTV